MKKTGTTRFDKIKALLKPGETVQIWRGNKMVSVSTEGTMLCKVKIKYGTKPTIKNA